MTFLHFVYNSLLKIILSFSWTKQRGVQQDTVPCNKYFSCQIISLDFYCFCLFFPPARILSDQSRRKCFEEATGCCPVLVYEAQLRFGNIQNHHDLMKQCPEVASTLSGACGLQVTPPG